VDALVQHVRRTQLDHEPDAADDTEFADLVYEVFEPGVNVLDE